VLPRGDGLLLTMSTNVAWPSFLRVAFIVEPGTTPAVAAESMPQWALTLTPANDAQPTLSVHTTALPAASAVTVATFAAGVAATYAYQDLDLRCAYLLGNGSLASTAGGVGAADGTCTCPKGETYDGTAYACAEPPSGTDEDGSGSGSGSGTGGSGSSGTGTGTGSGDDEDGAESGCPWWWWLLVLLLLLAAVWTLRQMRRHGSDSSAPKGRVNRR
jgi:uncharacterized membrane protein YgcG